MRRNSLQLTSLYGQSPEITNLVDRFDWFVTPVSNPDGYVYSWLTVRIRQLSFERLLCEILQCSNSIIDTSSFAESINFLL